MQGTASMVTSSQAPKHQKQSHQNQRAQFEEALGRVPCRRRHCTSSKPLLYTCCDERGVGGSCRTAGSGWATHKIAARAHGLRRGAALWHAGRNKSQGRQKHALRLDYGGRLPATRRGTFCKAMCTHVRDRYEPRTPMCGPLHPDYAVVGRNQPQKMISV